MKRLLAVLTACASSSEPAPAAKPAAPPPAPVVEGTLVTNAGLVGSTYQVRAAGRKVDASTLGLAAFLGGLPVAGMVDVDVAIDVGNGAADLAWGHVDVACNGCRLGDDVAKLQLLARSARTAAFAGDGLLFGHITVDHFAMTAKLDNGVGKITAWEWKSPDLDVQVSGTVELAHDPKQSAVHACIRFKPTEQLQQAQPTTWAMASTTGANMQPDGYFTIALEGKVGEIKRLARSCP